MSFVHLNVKTGFSFLEGALPLEQLCDRVKALGMDAVAVTDKGNLHGAYEFYKRAKKSGVNPILGSELQLLPEGVAIDDRSTRCRMTSYLSASSTQSASRCPTSTSTSARSDAAR